MSATKKPQWRCPKCGHRFVTKNLSHSCGNYSLKQHFRGKPPVLRKTFNRFAALARECGPVTIYAQKSRIVLQGRVRFAGVVVRHGFLDAHIWLRRKIEHPLISKIESFGKLGYACHFQLRNVTELDTGLAAFLREGYEAQK